MKLTYTNINHRARLRLKLKINEYCVADTIYHLSTNPKNKKNGWCYASKATIAQFLGFTRKTIITIEKKLIEYELIEKSGNLRRPTIKWYDNIILDEGFYYKNNSVEELKCFYCDKNILNSPMEVDHYISKTNGGTDDPNNLVLSCKECNQLKKTMNGDNFFELLGKPIKYIKREETTHPKGKKLHTQKGRNYTPEEEKPHTKKGRNYTPKREETTHPKGKKLHTYNNIDNNIYNNKEKNPPPLSISSPIKSPVRRHAVEDVRLVKILYDLVKENYPFLVERKTEKQETADFEEMNRMFRCDKIEYSKIEFVLRWSQKNNFWRQNIRSVKKLRKQFPTLMIQIYEEEKNKRNPIIDKKISNMRVL